MKLTPSRAIALGAAAFSLFCAMGHAEDLGRHGRTYSADPDAREEFKDVIRRKQRSGELDTFWRNYRDRTIDAIRNPAPLGIRSDYRPHSEFKPVRFVASSDYRDERGAVLVRRGTAIEPLKIKPLTSGLIFIDGRDQAQIDYAVGRSRTSPMKIVLTAGSPVALRARYATAGRTGQGSTTPFYFDQRRMIIDSLQRLYGIDVSSVPAVMTQQGTGVLLEFGLGNAR